LISLLSSEETFQARKSARKFAVGSFRGSSRRKKRSLGAGVGEAGSLREPGRKVRPRWTIGDYKKRQRGNDRGFSLSLSLSRSCL